MENVLHPSDSTRSEILLSISSVSVRIQGSESGLKEEIHPENADMQFRKKEMWGQERRSS
jgi:hypothetical protein